MGDGASVGIRVGVDVGLGVGSPVGNAVGGSVGAADGSSVGRLLGAGDGGSVGWSSAKETEALTAPRWGREKAMPSGRGRTLVGASVGANVGKEEGSDWEPPLGLSLVVPLECP